MNQHAHSSRCVITALTGVGLFCLSIGAALCQSPPRTEKAPPRVQPPAQGQGGAPATGQPAGTTGRSPSAPSTNNNSTNNKAVARQAAGRVIGEIVGQNRAHVQWLGSIVNVERVYLAVLGEEGKVISQTVVSKAPYAANLTTNANAVSYGAMITYKNGFVATVYSAIPR